MKRLLDIVVSLAFLIVLAPIVLPLMLLVWLRDFHSPLYLAPRVARGGGEFRMVKLRSMVVNADKTGVNSTAMGDSRVTAVGRVIRKFKLDELTQMWNVLFGDMSVVGPRPNTRAWGVDLYTPEELRLLTARPGITDFSSIVFADEGDILAGRKNPDLAYNELIRPWKSRLGLFYIDHANVALDVRLIVLTALAIVSRARALEGVARLLQKLGAPDDLVRVARRSDPLVPTPPPGANGIVTSRAMESVSAE
jgi:lipopolysaccharide/colanic/teichoic acid biosynthesis glycosyltransferase